MLRNLSSRTLILYGGLLFLGLSSGCGHLTRTHFTPASEGLTDEAGPYAGVGAYRPQGTNPSEEDESDSDEVAEEVDQPNEFAPPSEVLASPDVKKNVESSSRSRAHAIAFRLRAPVKHLKINRGYKTEGRRAHLGLDIAGHRGDRIFAAHDGVVIYVGRGFRGYGKMILLEYDNSWATLYGHLNRFKVKTGQEVKAGTLIGEMGRTGRATGVHLHFELIKDKDPIDPEPYLN
jgi:murein DD-endopeptidase MepM/ murein hydrolase activator NlpD